MPLLRLGALLLLVTAGKATANDKWWFDIEVILFDRNQAITQLEEQFDYADSLAPYQADYDLISKVLAPDIRRVKRSLPRCDAPPSPLWQPAPDLDTLLRDYRAWQAANADPRRSEPAPEQLPATQDSTDLQQADSRIEALTREATPSDNEPSPPITEPGVSDSDIAAHWLAFNGVATFPRVSVPDVAFCQPTVNWFEYQDGRWTQPVGHYDVPMPADIPIEPEGVRWPQATFAHLLPSDSRDLTELSQQIRRTRGLTRLLHTTWRQEVVFGRDKAPTMRLIAGKNYAEEFMLSGTQRVQAAATEETDTDTVGTTPDSLLERLNTRLNTPLQIDFNSMMAVDPADSQVMSMASASGKTPPIWQIDGGIKVFLRYINQVPYLHIDSELFYRQPVVTGDNASLSDDMSATPSYRLVSVPFSQLRRVISTQVHYFDHPLFGMIVEIRRYRQPEEDEEQQ